MSRKSKGTFTCKIVAQNERGMLGQVRDSVYRGVKYCGEDGQVEKTFCFPRKLAEEKWLEWLDADLTEDELRILEPLNRKQRRVAKGTNEHNAKLKAELPLGSVTLRFLPRSWLAWPRCTSSMCPMMSSWLNGRDSSGCTRQHRGTIVARLAA